MTNLEKAKSLMVMLQDSLAQYVNFGYPKDPAVYVVRVNPRMIPLLKKYFDSNFIPPFELDEESGTLGGFQFKEDKAIKPGRLMFGPEQLEIIWNGA